ncbi:unnamed protein product [Caenorhabditis brenneri]
MQRTTTKESKEDGSSTEDEEDDSELKLNDEEWMMVIFTFLVFSFLRKIFSNIHRIPCGREHTLTIYRELKRKIMPRLKLKLEQKFDVRLFLDEKCSSLYKAESVFEAEAVLKK